MGRIDATDLVTIVIPVYNLERYIGVCMDSVLKQTYRNIEILIVDDGSTDASPRICDEFAKRDSRVRVIHKRNEGLSVVRNIGAREAKGKYVAHIDGDDLLMPTYIEYLFGLLVEYSADISMCNFVPFMDGDEIPKKKAQSSKENVKIMTREQALETFLYQKYFTSSTWGKLFRRELLLRVEFAYGSTCEDMDSIYKLLHYSNKAVYSSKVQYFYRQRLSSIVHTCLLKREKDCLKAVDDMVEFIEGHYSDLCRAAYSKCFSSNIQILLTIPFDKIYDSNHKNVIDNIKKYRKDVLLNSKARIVSRGCAFVSYFGIRVLKLGLMIFR